MRGFRYAVLIVLLAAFVAVAMFWASTTQEPTPDAARPPSPDTSSSTGGGPASPARTRAAASPGDAFESDEAKQQDGVEATASPAQGALLVWGTISTELGEVTARQPIELYSPSVGRRYTAVSNEQGEFLFEDVAPASDYRVTVSPDGMYKAYRRRGIKIDADNATLDVVLKDLDTGVLQGEIVNPQGLPVPDFVVSVRSLAKDRGMRRVRSDSVGLFAVEDFPEGPFEVFSRNVLLRIRGLEFVPSANEVITLVVDHGSHELTGRVFDHHRQPVEGAVVVLSWTHSRGDAHSSVERRTLTGPDGEFTMAELAYGEHELVVAVPDGAGLRKRVTVGRTPAEMVLYLDGILPE